MIHMFFSKNHLRAFAAISAIVLSAVTSSANSTNVGAPGHPGTNVGISHNLPTPKKVQDPVLFSTADWTITLLTSASGLTPLQVSSDGAVVLLRDPATYYNDLFQGVFYRWSEGSTEVLGTCSNLGFINDPLGVHPMAAIMNSHGGIALNQNIPADGFDIGHIKIVQPTDSSANFLFTPDRKSFTRHDSYNHQTLTTNAQTADLIQFDDKNRIWFWGDGALINNNYFDTIPFLMDQNYFSQVVPIGVSAVARSGHYIGGNSVDGIPVDFTPTYINDHGLVLGYQISGSGANMSFSSFLRYPDGHEDVFPDNFNFDNLWIDNQDRLNGTNAGYPVLILKQLGADGQAVIPLQYYSIPYVPLVFPSDSGWTTDHLVAPDTVSPQLGIAVNTSTGAAVPFVATRNLQIAVDTNDDGQITFASVDDSDATSAANPFTWWLNDDFDNGDPSKPDYSTGVVNGPNDLKDFFPVALNLQSFVTAFPPGQYSYVLKQADGALAFTYTNLTTDHAYDYRDSQSPTGFGKGLSQPAASATVAPVTADGITLDSGFLYQIQSQGGVILLEAITITINANPLVLEIHNSNGTVIAATSIYIQPLKSSLLDGFDNGLAGESKWPVQGAIRLDTEITGYVGQEFDSSCGVSADWNALNFLLGNGEISEKNSIFFDQNLFNTLSIAADGFKGLSLDQIRDDFNLLAINTPYIAVPKRGPDPWALVKNATSGYTPFITDTRITNDELDPADSTVHAQVYIPNVDGATVISSFLNKQTTPPTSEAWQFEESSDTIANGMMRAQGVGTTIYEILQFITTAPVITSANNASGQVGLIFRYLLNANKGPQSFGATGLPSGLSLDTSTGVILGIPTVAGTFSVTVSATNEAGTGSAILTLNVTAN